MTTNENAGGAARLGPAADPSVKSGAPTPTACPAMKNTEIRERPATNLLGGSMR